jgi:hypothetical protein
MSEEEAAAVVLKNWRSIRTDPSGLVIQRVRTKSSRGSNGEFENV